MKLDIAFKLTLLHLVLAPCVFLIYHFFPFLQRVEYDWIQKILVIVFILYSLVCIRVIFKSITGYKGLRHVLLLLCLAYHLIVEFILIGGIGMWDWQ